MIASVLSLLLAQAPATPPSPLWDKLRARLQDADQRLDGVLSVSVEDLATGRTIDIRAGEAFATASCIKPAVLLELYHAAAGGKVDLQQAVPAPSPRVGGGGPLELGGEAAREVASQVRPLVDMPPSADRPAEGGPTAVPR